MSKLMKEIGGYPQRTRPNPSQTNVDSKIGRLPEFTRPHEPVYDGSHISTNIRSELDKLGPEKAQRVRDVADKKEFS